MRDAEGETRRAQADVRSRRVTGVTPPSSSPTVRRRILASMDRWLLYLLGGVSILLAAFSAAAAVYAAVQDDPGQMAAWGIGGVLVGLLGYWAAESRATRE
jgi:hypothetical protein